jgi:hypothetical protein
MLSKFTVFRDSGGNKGCAICIMTARGAAKVHAISRLTLQNTDFGEKSGPRMASIFSQSRFDDNSRRSYLARCGGTMKSCLLHKTLSLTALTVILAACSPPATQEPADLWQVYERSFKTAKYIDLSHTITPTVPVWKGFGPSRFQPSSDPKTGKAYSYDKDGFEATSYELSTDQLGTQLDPPAHWAPEYPAIDELPPTFTLRPLVVISIVDKIATDVGYHLQVADIEQWEKTHGMVPEGSVVMVRSDWSKEWPDPALALREKFPVYRSMR